MLVPRMPQCSRSLPRAVAMHNLLLVSCPAQLLSHVFRDHHRAMLAAGATEADGQVALALANVVGEQLHQQFRDAADEFLCLRKRPDILGDPGMGSFPAAEFID